LAGKSHSGQLARVVLKEAYHGEGIGAERSAGPQELSMQTFQPSIFARPDTLLGICQAIGDDLGINPNYFRVALAGGVFFNFSATMAVYLAAGAIVLASRLLYRAPRKLVSQPVVEAAPVAEAAAVDPAGDVHHDRALVPMAIAA
jgi:phage shock protein PspC (stress-responsive transcriptional regulator)